ncbi:MAG: DUF4266 domain-containing protein [Actinobacteria bacterium]|nr:DUF4266 domain-containing protein [Actinomycetota bacterium]
MKPSKLPLALLIGFTLNLLGCTHVQPWERGTLAKPQMALNTSPLQSTMRAHNYGSREAGAGSTAGQGGGCGCN